MRPITRPGPVGALAYWTVDAIKRYVRNPGPLVPV